MNSADKIKRFFKQAKLNIHPEADEEIFQDVFEAQQKTIKSKPAQPVNFQKIFTKKIAAAAIVVIACIIGLKIFNDTSKIALANVLKQIEKIDSYMYEVDITIKDHAAANSNVEASTHEITLFSREHGIKKTINTNVNQSEYKFQLTQYIIPKDKIIIQINPNQKTYMLADFDDDYAERIENQSYDPDKIIGQVISCKYNSLGISTLDGKTVEGFQTDDSNYAGGIYGKVDFKLWVDVKTKLPVQMKMNYQLEDRPNTDISMIVYNYQWNIPVDASEFEPVIPDDYTSSISTSIQMPPNTEQAAIEGLKLYTEFFDNYPNDLNLSTMIPKIEDSNTPVGIQFQKELNELSPQERRQKDMETKLAIAGVTRFYILLGQENKDPAYYGDIVLPGDADKVLMRWKVSDNDYRVIFGDLRVETVPADTLEELEKTLPK